MKELFCKEYYTTRNYRQYLTRKFDALAGDIVKAARILPSDRVLDYGCGYGGLMLSLWNIGIKNVIGTDISQWAIEHGHTLFPGFRESMQFYNRDLLRRRNDYILVLDVFEHMPECEVENVIKLAREGCGKLMVIRIPVCANEGERFVLDVSNNDPTHITCHTKVWWTNQFAEHGFRIESLLQEPSIYDSNGVFAATLSVG